MMTIRGYPNQLRFERFIHRLENLVTLVIEIDFVFQNAYY